MCHMKQDDKKRKQLIEDAGELDQQIQFCESELAQLLSEIRDLNPTKKELKDGLQDLMDCYL